MNKERILKLAETIEHYGDEHLDMSSLCNRGSSGNPTRCGTTACVAGWAMRIGKQAREIVRLSDDDGAISQVQRWLGIDEGQGHALFYPQGYILNMDSDGVRYTAARAGAVLRHLAETGEVAWQDFDEDGRPR